MKSDLPNSSQFSPVQTSLPDLLKIVAEHEPNRREIAQAIQERFFSVGMRRTTSDPKLANNTILAMSEYGLVDKPTHDTSYLALTDIGCSLLSRTERGDDDGLYREFARHILLNLHGLDLVTAASDLVARGETPTKALIVRELGRRGIYHPPNGTHANGVRQWLESAGIVPKGEWVADVARLQELLGYSSDDLDALAGLTREQREFARAFARLNTDQELSNKVARYATALFGTEFPEGGLPQLVLFALRDAGLIECEKTTGGQGAKPYIVRPTDKLRNEVIEPLLVAIEQSVGMQYRRLIRMKYADILTGLEAQSSHEKGLALEALAFYLGRLLGLRFVQWRLRSSQTGGSELDVVMESARLVYSRWQIQCMRSSELALDDVAREVGIAQVTKSNVIMIVTTGQISTAARQFAGQVMCRTPLYVVLIDGTHLNQLRQNREELVNILEIQAEGAMSIKRGPEMLV